MTNAPKSIVDVKMQPGPSEPPTGCAAKRVLPVDAYLRVVYAKDDLAKTNSVYPEDFFIVPVYGKLEDVVDTGHLYACQDCLGVFITFGKEAKACPDCRSEDIEHLDTIPYPIRS